MERAGHKSIQKRKKYNHLGMYIIAVFVIVVFVGLMYECRSLENSVAVYTARAAELEDEITYEQSRTDEIEEMKEYMLTDEYAEQAAREYIGLVKENEIIFEEEN